MTSTGIGATLFAIGVVQLPADIAATAVRRGEAMTSLRDALVRNVNGTIVKTAAATLAVPAGDARTVRLAEAVEAEGRDATGRAVRLAARFYIVDDRLFQLVALGAKGELPQDALDMFFTSFRLIR